MPYGTEITRVDTYGFHIVRTSDDTDCQVTIGPNWNASATDADKDTIAQAVMDALSGMPGFTVSAAKQVIGYAELTPNP